MTNRLFSVGSLLDWMADGSLPGGVRFLSRAHGEDTHAKAMELLKKAVGSCKDETKDKPSGSPAPWAILLAQQAHALQYDWGAGNPTLWDVHAMHELLRERQDQRVTQEGGSRAPRDTRTVPRGLRTAQQVRDIHPLPLLGPHTPFSPPLRAAGRPQQRGCAHARAPRG